MRRHRFPLYYHIRSPSSPPPGRTHDEIFVHCSSLGGGKLLEGSFVFFDAIKGRDGKLQAANIQRLQANLRPRAKGGQQQASTAGLWEKEALLP